MSGIKGRLREWPYAVLGISLLWVTLRALEKILSGYTRDFDQDPLKHNVYAYTAPSFGAMLHQIKNLYQPALDFALRRYLVFPILGVDERAFRIPGSICYLLALGIVPALIYVFLKKQAHHNVVAVSGALLCAFWILENKLLLAYGVEGRHYMAAAWVSMIWFCCVFLFESKPQWAFFLSSLIFANTHLFSFPLIATAFGIHTVRCCWDRNWKELGRLTLAGFAILAVTVAVNYPAVSSLIQKPPGAAHHPFARSLQDAKTVGWHFLDLLALPLGWLLLPLGIAGALMPKKRVGFAVIACLVFPSFLVYMRSKSDYHYHDRYHLPFFGLGAVFIAYGVDAAARAFGNLGSIARLARSEFLSSGALALALVLAFPAKDALRTFADLGKIRIPNKNITDGYKYYRRIRELPAPKLVIFKPRNVGDRHVPNYYLVVDRQPDDAEIEVISSDPGKAAKKDASVVQTFWREHTDATVVFDWPKQCLRGASNPSTTVRSKTRCSLIVPQVKGPEEFNTLLASLGVTLRG